MLFCLHRVATATVDLWSLIQREKNKNEITAYGEKKGELKALVTLYELNIRMNNWVVKIRGQTQTEARAAFSQRSLM